MTFVTHTFIYSKIFIRKYFVFIIHIIIVFKLTHWNKSYGLKPFKTQKERGTQQGAIQTRTRFVNTAVLSSRVGGVARTRFEASRALSSVDPEGLSLAHRPAHASHTRPRTSRACTSGIPTRSFSSFVHPKSILQVCKA